MKGKWKALSSNVAKRKIHEKKKIKEEKHDDELNEKEKGKKLGMSEIGEEESCA